MERGQIIFGGLPNYVDSETLTAYSEESTLPVSNLQDYQPSFPWRSTDATLGNTGLSLSLTNARKMEIVAVIGHNLSTGAEWRIRCHDDDLGNPKYDSGWIDAWPTVYEFGTLAWGEFTWGGVVSADEVEDLYFVAFHLIPDGVLASDVEIEFDDTGNSDGYVEAGRLVIGPTFQPKVGMDWGWSIRFEDPSIVTKSRGGQTWIDEKEKFRVARLSLEHMTRDEALNQVLGQMQRTLGTTGDFLVVLTPDDESQHHNTTLYCRQRLMAEPIAARYGEWSIRGIELEELI